MLIHENATWAQFGMDFGNEGFDALLYTLAALEVTKPNKKPAAKRKPPTTKKPTNKARTKAKRR